MDVYLHTPYAFRDNFASTSYGYRIVSSTGTINGIYQGHDNIKKYAQENGSCCINCTEISQH